jgi:hypothetical protein
MTENSPAHGAIHNERPSGMMEQGMMELQSHMTFTILARASSCHSERSEESTLRTNILRFAQDDSTSTMYQIVDGHLTQRNVALPPTLQTPF